MSERIGYLCVYIGPLACSGLSFYMFLYGYDCLSTCRHVFVHKKICLRLSVCLHMYPAYTLTCIFGMIRTWVCCIYGFAPFMRGLLCASMCVPKPIYPTRCVQAHQFCCLHVTRHKRAIKHVRACCVTVSTHTQYLFMTKCACQCDCMCGLRCVSLYLLSAHFVTRYV